MVGSQPVSGWGAAPSADLEKSAARTRAEVPVPLAPRTRGTRQYQSGGTEVWEAHELAAIALAKTLLLHDPVTGLHLERLPLYTELLAAELAGHPRHRGALRAEMLAVLPRASTLHDVGKLGIPESILRKAGRLTPQEYAVMKRHTTLGCSTLQELLRRSPRNPFLAVGRDIALYHHERWDGGGYPFGLGGAQIALPARIVALADVYDALRSQRPYKPAYSHGVARRFIVAQAGAQFDPDVVEAFLACEQDFRDVAAAKQAHAPARIAAVVAPRQAARLPLASGA
jgi:cyclic di-GMP phosphodiesterase